MRLPRPVSSIFKGARLFAGSLFFYTCGFAGDETTGKVTFVEWNLKNYLHTVTVPATQAPRETKPKPAREVAAVTRILTGLRPDILGVCEMGDAEDLAGLQQRLKEAGVDLPHSELVEGADRERHVGLLSRFPITVRQSQPHLSYLLDEAKLPMQRGILDVTLQVTKTYSLRCVGVHLKSRLTVPGADEGLMRRNEAHLVRRHLDGVLTAAPETNLLVFGDFNDTRDQPSIRAIPGMRGEPTYLTTLTPSDAHGERWTYYYKDNDTYSRIDYLFASRGLMPEVDAEGTTVYSGADWSVASDHRPITTLIQPVEKVRRTRPRKPAAAEETTEEEPEE